MRRYHTSWAPRLISELKTKLINLTHYKRDSVCWSIHELVDFSSLQGHKYFSSSTWTPSFGWCSWAWRWLLQVLRFWRFLNSQGSRRIPPKLIADSKQTTNMCRLGTWVHSSLGQGRFGLSTVSEKLLILFWSQSMEVVNLRPKNPLRYQQPILQVGQWNRLTNRHGVLTVLVHGFCAPLAWEVWNRRKPKTIWSI